MTTAELATVLCQWTLNDGDHVGYHHGWPCPIVVMNALTDGHPDPRELVAEWRVDIPFPDGKPPISLNDRSVHWAVHASKVEKVKALTRNAVRGADVPQLGRVHVELHYRGRTNAVRDADNYVATLKVCIDALHHPDERSLWVPIIQGDDARYVSWSKPVLHPAVKGAGAGTWLILRSYTAAAATDQPEPAVQEALL